MAKFLVDLMLGGLNETEVDAATTWAPLELEEHRPLLLIALCEHNTGHTLHITKGKCVHIQRKEPINLT